MSEPEEPTIDRSTVPLPDHLGGYDDPVLALRASQAAKGLEAAAADELRAFVREAGAGLADGRLPTAKLAELAELAAGAQALDEHASTFRSIAERAQGGAAARVRSEPRTYGPGSPHSFYRDHALSAVAGHPEQRTAAERLRRHGHEVSVEVRSGSPEGRRALRAADTRGRDAGGDYSAQIEARAGMTTGSGSGGSFTTPQYLVDRWADWRTNPPSFARACTQVPDGGEGMELYVPSFTSGPTVAKQATENTAVSNTTPTGAYLSAPLVTMAGELDCSQQLLDRTGPGITFDQVAHDQLASALWSTIDAYVLAEATASAGTVTDTSTFSVADFWGDVAKAAAAMQTTSGTVLPPTHLFMQPTFGRWLLAQSDPSGRPLALPAPVDAPAPFPLDEDGRGPIGYSGQRVLDVPAFFDGNIANGSGSTSQILVANCPSIYVMVSEPTVRCFPETLAQDLEVVVQLYSYVGVVVKYTAGVQIVGGSAYPASPTFA